MRTLFYDLRYGARMLLKQPGFTAVTLIALAVGIGANTAIFSLVNGILLRPLPYPNSQQIVGFEGINPAQGIKASNISFPDFVDWSKQSDLFAASAAYYTGNSNLAADDAEPERIPRTSVTSDFFSVLRVQPARGRIFRAEEDRPGNISVVILGDGLWKRRFGSDPNIIGKQITLSARPVTVIGVMPPGFDFPEQSQIWTPSAVNPNEEPRDNRSFSAIARLRDGVDLSRAQAQISAIDQRLAREFPDTSKGWDARVSILRDQLVREARPALIALLGAVGFVLLIACANVANLLLARAAGRQKEIAIRAAMGASRARVVRQMLTESVLLSALGGGLGLILSFWLTDLLRSLMPEGAPRMDQIGLDYRVLAFAIGVSALTGFIFGLVPALQASKLDVTSSLKQGGRTGEGQRRSAARSFLLLGEVALSLILLVGAGLLIKSFLRLQEVRPGFNPDHVLVTSLSLPGAKYKNQQRVEFFRQLAQRLQILPGVEAVGGGINLPLGASNYDIGRAFIPEGRSLTVDESNNASFSTITGDYFRALQIPLIAGRFFNERDTGDSPKTVIINETIAKKYFDSPQNALGKRLTIWRDEKFAREIVGVVGDTHTSSLLTEGGAQIYVPHAQDTSWNFIALVIRTAGDPAALAPAIRHEVQMLDRDQPVYNVRTMNDVVANSIGAQRLSMQLFAAFAVAALLLAAVGIYGVMAYSVTQRTQEIGIRMALGAQRGDVLRLVVRQGFSLTLIGIAVGIAGAFALTRVISTLLFGVSATDLATFIAVSFFLILVSLAACYFPARRASKVNPVHALAHN